MFTTVNSARKKVQQTINLDAEHNPASPNSNVFKIKNSLLIDFFNFFSLSNDYFKLQLAIFSITFLCSLVIAVSTCIFISLKFGLSIFIGSIVGIFYLRLLAKSIGNLGKSSSGVSKLQLLLPVCLFIFASKNEFIEIFPAIIGFFLYKPSLFFIFSRP